MAENSLFGNLMGGVSSIGRGILNIPTNIGKKYEAGTLFGGGGALGDLLGQQARQEAQRQAIMKLGLGLLGQEPSRTPISFGQSLASGLLGAQEAYKQDLQGQLGDFKTLLSLKREQYPEVSEVKGFDLTTGKPETLQLRISPSGERTYTVLSTGEPVDWSKIGLSKPTEGTKEQTKVSEVKGFDLSTGSPKTLRLTEDPNGLRTYIDLATGEPVDWSKTALSKPDVAKGRRSQDAVSFGYVVTVDGDIIPTYFDKEKRKQVNAHTGEPVGAGVIPISQAKFQTGDFFKGTRQALSTEETALSSMDKYMEGLAKDPKGMERYFNKINQKIISAFGGTPTPEQMASAINEGRLQGLIGQVREEVVGPGVMTEFDAIRIIMSLGGDYSIFQSPEAALQLIGETRNKKYKAYTELLGEYNRALKTLPEASNLKRVYLPKDPYQLGLFPNQNWFNAGMSIEDWNSLSEEDKKQFLAENN